MRNLNFLRKSERKSVGTTLALTVGSPSAHRRYSALKHLAFMLLFLLGSLNVWGAITNNNNGTYTEPSGSGTAGNGIITWSFAGGNITVVQSKTGGTNVNTSYTSAARVYQGNTLTVSASNGFKVEKVEIVVSTTYYGAGVQAGTSVSNNTVGNLSDVSTSLTTTSGGTHTFTPATEGAKTLFYIRNQNTGTDNVQIRWAGGGLKVTYSYTAPTTVAKGTVTSSSFGLDITDALNTNKYDVYFDTDGTAPTATTTATVANQETKTPTISSGVTASTTYYVWVRSVKTINTDTWKSAWKALTGNTLTTESGASCTSEITITKGTPSNGTFTMTPDEGNVCIDGGNASVAISDITPVSGFRFKEITSSGGGTINNNAKTVTNISANTTINVVFEQIPPFTVSFITGTGNTPQADIPEASSQAGITLPDAPSTIKCAADGWGFAGWSETNVSSETAIAPTLFDAGSTYHPADNCTLYAVYSREESGSGVAFARYEAVTSAPSDWSGNYVLSTGTYTATGSFSSNALSCDEWTPGTTEATSREFVISKIGTTSHYSIALPGGKTYIGKKTGSSPGTDLLSSTTAPTTTDDDANNKYKWTLSTTVIANVALTARKLAGNSTTPTIVKGYSDPESGSSYPVFKLYRRVEETATVTYYLSAPTCCIALGALDGVITLSNEGCAATELKATWKMAATTGIASQVLHVYKSSDDSEIDGSKITGITASTENQTKTIEGLQAGTSYYVKVENISEGGDYCASSFAGTSEAASTHSVYLLAVQADDSGKGTISLRDAADENDMPNNTSYMAGTVLTVKASVTDPTVDQFVNWTVEPANAVTFTNANAATTTITIGTQAATITANFQEIPSTKYTVTFNQGTLGTLDCNACSESALEEASAGAGVTLPSCVPSAGNYAFLGWTATPSGTTVDDGANAGDVYHPAANTTLYAVYKQLKTVTLMKRDDSGTDVVLYENPATGKVELQTRTCKNSNYSFAGWSTKYYENEQEGADVVIQPVGEYEPTADVTLYPVFKRGEEAVIWTRTAVADVTAGVYAIITPDGKAFNGTVNSSGHGESTENAFSFTNGVATSAPTGTCELTIAAVTNGYTMYNATTNKYLYASDNTAGSLGWHDSESSYWKKYTNNNVTNWQYVVASNKYANLRSYNSTFRTYSNNNGDVLEFVKREEQHAYYVAAPANLVLAPTFTPVEGTYYGTQSVTLSCETENTTIYYTIGADPADPTNSSDEYSDAIPVSASQIIKAIAYDNEGFHSEVAAAAYTIYPVYTTIADFVSAEPAPAKAKLQFTAESNAVVLGKTSNNIYLQDNTGALLLYKNGHGKDWATGEKVVGSLIGSYLTYNEMPEMQVTEFVEGIVATEGGVMPTPVTITEINSEIFAANACKLVKMEGVNFQNTNLSSNAVTINKGETPYTVFNTFSVLNQPLPLQETTCDIVGVLNSAKVNEVTTYRIAPISVDGISTNGAYAVLPTISDAGGPDAEHAVEVAQGKNITMTKAENFDAIYQLNDGDETAIETNTAVAITETASATKLYVKASRYYYTPVELTYYYIANASLAEHTITCATGLEGGSVNAGGVASALPNVQISLSAVPADHYTFGAWDVYETGNETNKVTVENNQFSMPEYNVTVSATFVEDAHAIVEYIGGTGATGAAAVPSEKVYLGEGAHATMPAKGTLALTGNTFAGWQLNGEGAVLAVGDTYEVNTAGTLTFKAAWTPYPWTGNGKWELVTDASTLAVNDYIIVASNAEEKALGAQGSDVRTGEVIVRNEDKSLITNIGDATVLQLKAGNVANSFALLDYAENNYLAATSSSSNYIGTSETVTNDASWAISMSTATGDENIAVVAAQGTYTRNLLRSNTQSHVFSCYGSNTSVAKLMLYKFVAGSFFNITYAKGTDDEVTNMPATQVTASDGTAILSDKVPVYVGYTFLGWSDGVNTYDPSDPIGPLSANTTLTAQWKTATEHSLSYDKNDGEGDVPAVTSYYPNAQVTLAAALTKDGLLFAGWEDENGMVYAAGSSFTMPNTDVVLTAKFVTGAVYTVATRTSVNASGEPEGSTATFNNTANTGTVTQITGSNSMTLTLTDYDLYTIKGLTLNMRSNGSSGNGTLSVTIGGNAVSFTTNKWYDGTHHSGSYEDIQVSFDPIRVMPDEEIVITIAATASSLYCQSFTLEYERVLDELRGGLTEGKWGTYCPDHDVKYPAGASFYTLTYKEVVAGQPYKVFFDEVEPGAALVGGKPYLFIADGEAIKGIKVGDAASLHNYNGFTGVLSDYILNVTASESAAYKYYVVYGNEIRLCGAGKFNVPAERAYLDMSQMSSTPVAQAPGRRRISLVNHAAETATGIENAETNEAPRKVLINGELFIIRGEKMYDAKGQLVK